VIAHLVLFRPRAGLADADRRGLAEALSTAARDIPSIRRVRVGTRVTHGRAYEQLMRVHYSHVAMLEFDDVDGLQAYLAHPAHDALAARFFAAFEEALFYDFEIESEAGIATLLAG
jgi:hypothetical protein